MPKLPEPDWLALSESARRATRVFGAERVTVETALVTAFHDGKIDTRGRCRSWFGHDTLMKLRKPTWDKANVRWQVNEFAVPSGSQSSHRDHTFSDVEVHREDLERWVNGAAPDSLNEPQEAVEIAVPEVPSKEKKPQARRRGRRPQYDWALFHAEIARMVGKDPDGFPVIQADLEHRMMDWCVATWGENNCPAESTIRSQVSRYYNDDSQGR